MARSDEIKSLTQDIAAAYEARLSALGQLVADTHDMLDDFQKGNFERKDSVASLLKDFRTSHEEMSQQLRAELAKVKPELAGEEAERVRQAQAEIRERIDQVTGFLNDFRTAHEEMSQQLKAELAKVKPELAGQEAERVRQTQAEIKERINQVTGFLNDFRTAHEEMSRELKAELGKVKPELAGQEAERVRQTQAEIKERIDQVRSLLSDFTSTHEEMSARLKADLASGEAERLGQANADLQQRQVEVRERIGTVSQLLGDFRAEGEKTAAAWQELASIMQGKRGMKAVEIKIPAKAPPAEKEAMPPAEPAKMAPGKADLSDGVFAYLGEHPGGARMTELEEAFGVARIQMANTLKSLMEENKVEKRDMDYFAL